MLNNKLAESFLNAIEKQQDIVLFHLPDDANVHLYRGTIGPVNAEEGFLVCPFEGKGYLLKPEEVIVAPITNGAGLPAVHDAHPGNKPFTATKEEYISLVESAVHQIHTNAFKKVVLSRAEAYKLPSAGAKDRIGLFYALAKRYPGAFVYYLNSPQLGSWMGCSPELLVKRSGNKIESMALAGTSSEQEESLAQQSFKTKEVEEQGIVEHFIEEGLKPFTVNLEKEGPGLRKAGKLFHLYTRFSGLLKADVSLQNLLTALHPTPAVGGYPSAASLKFIRQHEGYDRSLYSGYLGPVLPGGDAEIYVNLRCMQFTDSHEALLYAGAGIVKGSDPEMEWEETRQKMQTLLQVIHER